MKHNQISEEGFNSPDRGFLLLKNQCGPFKSAYAQNLLNQLIPLRKKTFEGGITMQRLDQFYDEKSGGAEKI